MNDIVRTHQDMDFFQCKEVQELMVDIMELWCKKESSCYYQGMNEIISCVTYALTAEKLDCAYDNLEQLINPDDAIRYLQSSKYLKHDIFTVFDSIMQKGTKELFIQEGARSTEDKVLRLKKEQLFQWGSDISMKNVNKLHRLMT